MDEETDIHGKALKIYLYMLKMSRSVGLSEIQRKLGFKNPSHVAYYLDKLISLGLVRRNGRGKYSVSKEVKIGVLKYFIRIGRRYLPRYLFYATFVTGLLVGYVVRFFPELDLFVLLMGGASSAILWMETYRLHKEASEGV